MSKIQESLADLLIENCSNIFPVISYKQQQKIEVTRESKC